MACAIGLSRILREDRATKDGYILRSDEHVPDAGPGQFMSVAHVARPQGISCNLKPFA